jgi:hypothetical protein
MTLNYGVALFFAVLFYCDFRRKIDKLDTTIGNHLTHALQANTDITKEDSESSKRVERAVNEMSSDIKLLTCSIRDLMEIKK